MKIASNLLSLAWAHAWKTLNLAPPAGAWEALWAAYGEPQRFYHTGQHLEELFALFPLFSGTMEHPGEAALALFYHDAIYDPRRSDNEALSAAWARRVLGAAGAEEAVIGRVTALIEDTQTHHPRTPDSQAVCDLDLAILAASPERFSDYEHQIRAEYAWVPQPVFWLKRRAILKSFQRPLLYHTAVGQAQFQKQALLNLKKAVG